MQVDRDEKLFRDRGFKGRMGFGTSPALVIIDMQKGFTNPDAPLGSNLDSQIAATVPLLDVAHRRNIPVFFSVCVYDDPELKDAGIWINKIKGLDTLRAGTVNVEVDERLDRRPGDTVLRKRYASCFFGTDLVSRLAAARIELSYHHRLHHQRMRQSDRRQLLPVGLQADCGARGRWRPFRPRRTIRAFLISITNTPTFCR